MSDLAIIARKLALRHIRRDVERGISEHYLSLTWHRSSCGWSFVENNPSAQAEGFGAYDVSIGGWYDYGPDGRGRKQAPNTKIVVHEVCGETINMVFSLHELYEECRKGQLAFL